MRGGRGRGDMTKEHSHEIAGSHLTSNLHSPYFLVLQTARAADIV